MRHARILAPALAWLALGCQETTADTRVVLEIDADAALRADTRRLELASAGAASRADLPDVGPAEVLAGGELAWPQRALLTPLGDDAQRVFVAEISARDGGGSLLARTRLESGYVPGETVTLHVRLVATCRDLVCPGGACDGGRCVDPWIDPHEPDRPREPIARGDDAGDGDGDGDTDGAREDGGMPDGSGDAPLGDAPQTAPGQEADDPQGSADGGAGPAADAAADVDAAAGGQPGADAGDGGPGADAGDGAPTCGQTPAEPCRIHDCDELLAIVDQPDAHHVLSAPIDCGGRPLTPIPRLGGSLDGTGLPITGLSIIAEARDDVGLFAQLDGAQVRNLSIVAARVHGRDRVGLLAGSANDALIDRVHVDGSVTARDHAGALVGLADGIEVTQSYATGQITAESGALLLGRVAAASPSRIVDSYAAVGLGGPAPALTAGAPPNTVASFYTCELAGACIPEDPHALPDRSARRIARLAAFGWDFTTPVWGARMQHDLPCLRFEAGCTAQPISGQAPEGQGSSADPYRIGSCAQLQWMGRHPEAHYVLSGNVDCTGYHVGDRRGFWPVGSRGRPFSGVLDGAGFRITGLTIRRPWLDDTSLLGVVSGRVHDITLDGALVLGGRRAALLASELSGEVERCSVQGHVLARSEGAGVAGAIKGGAVRECIDSAQVSTGE